MNFYKQEEIARHSSNLECYLYLFNVEEFLLSGRILLYPHWRFNLVLAMILSLYGLTTLCLTTLLLLSSAYQRLNRCTGSHISTTELAQLSSSPKKLTWLSAYAKKQNMAPSGTLSMHWHWVHHPAHHCRAGEAADPAGSKKVSLVCFQLFVDKKARSEAKVCQYPKLRTKDNKYVRTMGTSRHTIMLRFLSPQYIEKEC